jgi:hypothetical protein
MVPGALEMTRNDFTLAIIQKELESRLKKYELEKEGR